MADDQRVALRKRQQITSAARTMFLWVALASAVIGAAAVVSVFLVQKLVFNEEVLAEKRSTVQTLEANNEAAPKLKDNVRILNTNEALGAARATDDEEPAQVVLDALPSAANSAALGSSLQSNKLLASGGVSIDTLEVTPILGSEGNNDDVISISSSGLTVDNSIQFRFTVSASKLDSLKAALARLERSIRIIDMSSVTVKQQGNEYSMSGEGVGYYQPAQTVDLKEKELTP